MKSLLQFILRPVVFDGMTYVAIAVFTSLNTSLGSDEAAKYVPATVLFWLKLSFGTFSAGALSVKMYRSTTFAEYRAARNGSFHADDSLPTKPLDTPPSPPNTP